MDQYRTPESRARMRISVTGVSDVGRVRKNNEDSFIVADLTVEHDSVWSGELPESSVGHLEWLLAVADGLGGAQAGEVASQIAANELVSRVKVALRSHSSDEALTAAIKEINSEIRTIGQSKAECRGMGATLTAAVVSNGEAVIGQVGDSRSYLIRNNKIYQVTKDQSLLQALIDAGQFTEETAVNFPNRNIILSALGAADDVEPVITRVSLARSDLLLLCSDGLSNKVSSPEMLDIALRAGSLDIAAKQLIDLANKNGGEDNITLILARFEGEGLPEPDPHSGTVEIEHL
jgi:serine/threonine protein phosphatase PrpC